MPQALLSYTSQVLALWEMIWAEDLGQRAGTWGEPGAGAQPGLLLFFLAALTLRQRRQLIDDCRDHVCFHHCILKNSWVACTLPVVTFRSDMHPRRSLHQYHMHACASYPVQGAAPAEDASMPCRAMRWPSSTACAWTSGRRCTLRATCSRHGLRGSRLAKACSSR